jgi:hypothetical protein
MSRAGQARRTGEKWCAAAKTLTGELQIVSVKAVAEFRRE